MSTVDNVWDNVETVLNVAEKKTTKAYEISKKKLREKKLENKIDDLYKALGRICYVSKSKGGCINDDEVNGLVDEINNVKAQLKRVRAEIAELRYERVCPSCNAGIKKDDEFCGKCGAKVE